MKVFGFIKGMSHGESVQEPWKVYQAYENHLPKDQVVAYMKSLDGGYACMYSKEMFTGEPLTAGIYEDGEYCFPFEFVHYYEHYDIGLPPDYEAYLKEKLG